MCREPDSPHLDTTVMHDCGGQRQTYRITLYNCQSVLLQSQRMRTSRYTTRLNPGNIPRKRYCSQTWKYVNSRLEYILCPGYSSGITNSKLNTY
jgi:hypothetical protein